MSRLSDDHRSGRDEVRTVIAWSAAILVVIAIIAIAVFLWAFVTLHFYR